MRKNFRLDPISIDDFSQSKNADRTQGDSIRLAVESNTFIENILSILHKRAHRMKNKRQKNFGDFRSIFKEKTSALIQSETELHFFNDIEDIFK